MFSLNDRMSASSVWQIRRVFLLSLLFPLISAQQYGSFFSVINLNGAPISSSQVSCSGMGQPSYCCASGQYCAWDNSGQLACCPDGTTCSGNVGAVAGQYTQHPVQQTQVVYQTTPQNHCGCCGCVETSSTPVVNVLPVVPLTTSPVYPQTIITVTTTPVVGAVVATNACPNGYSTVTNANVGAPTRVVGCFVIIDSGAEKMNGLLKRTILITIAWVLWVS